MSLIPFIGISMTVHLLIIAVKQSRKAVAFLTAPRARKEVVA